MMPTTRTPSTPNYGNDRDEDDRHRPGRTADLEGVGAPEDRREDAGDDRRG